MGERDAVVRSLKNLGRWPRPDGDGWVDRLLDPTPWTDLPEEPLPRWLDRYLWWDFEVPARVMLRHLRLRGEGATERMWLAGRFTQQRLHVRQFLQGANESGMPVPEAVDLLLLAAHRQVDSLGPLLEHEVASARVGDVAMGKGKRWEAAEAAGRLLVARDDPRAVGAVRHAALASASELRAWGLERIGSQPEAAVWVLGQVGKGSADRRMHAATLAARLAGEDAARVLRDRFAVEKSEKVRVALLRGLERLGVDVAEVLDRDALVAQMQAVAVKKGTRPKGLDLDALPRLRWSDGSDVPRELVDAWVATCHKAKKPVPTPMLSVLARGLDAEDAAVFAVELFRFWVSLDSCDTNPYWGHHKGTATADKGLFALVGALADERIVDEVRGYVTTHYGWRSAQCKAMLSMLAHVGHPAGIQYLFQVAARFRTRGIKMAARAEIESLAERRGWTRDELADRTLDDAGLDDEPLVYLDEAGNPTRSFLLRLTEELLLQVVDEDGSASKGLPKARVGEDPSSEKAAKRRLSAARKALKSFVKAQTERLRDALLTQRTWTLELWREVSRHPVAGELFRRLLWRAGEVVFRLDEDGRVVGADDEEVHVGDDAEIRLAHALFLDGDEAARWAEHLADFEILPLFPQLGRPVWRTPDASADGIASGATGSALRLRSAARRLGYDMGAAGDGGYVHGFERDHPGLGLTVELVVDELRHPIEDVTVTLQHACFVRDGYPVPLGRLPEVLVSEVRADLVDIRTALER